MAATINGVFVNPLQEKVKNSLLLVVGAGGIGCEILKNLVMSGFTNIEIIDLDTIDISNLNRQFLFHREHVGKSKALIARESALQFNPDAKIMAYHDTIFSTTYGVNFFKKFAVVLNALDNRAARNHVNRMCLNAEVPLIESGTAGYNGQVELIKKGLTQCYECTPKAPQKNFPGCTIRNTPSEPIHCIVWAKHLFNQLFGESIDDEDISPDIADKEAQTPTKKDIDIEELQESRESVIKRVNTRQWAKDIDYDPEKLFKKFFFDDIEYLLSMKNLWESRKSPIPLKWESVIDPVPINSFPSTTLMQQRHSIWSLHQCALIFSKCVYQLKDNLEKIGNDTLIWDKDDQPSMEFVAACANLRAHIFDIPKKSCFEVKSMAGNIIPAIASTNAITAGIVVLHTFKVLQDDLNNCKSVYMRLRPNPRRQVVVSEKMLMPPNPNCLVCSVEPAITLRIDTRKMSIKEFRDKVLIKVLNMINPDVIIPVKGVVVISSEEGETTYNENKLLYEINIVDGVLLKCDDFFQNYELSIIIVHFDAKHDEILFEVSEKNQFNPKKDIDWKVDEKPSTSKQISLNDDDDLVLVEEYEKNERTTSVLNYENNLIKGIKDGTSVKKRKTVKDSSNDQEFNIIGINDSNDLGKDESPQCKRKKLSPLGEECDDVINIE